MGFKLNQAPEIRTTITGLVLTPVAGAQPARTINLTYSWDKLSQDTLIALLGSDKTKKDQLARIKVRCLGEVIHAWNIKDEAGGNVDPDATVIASLPALVIDKIFEAVKPPTVGAVGYMIDVAAFFA